MKVLNLDVEFTMAIVLGCPLSVYEIWSKKLHGNTPETIALQSEKRLMRLTF